MKDMNTVEVGDCFITTPHAASELLSADLSTVCVVIKLLDYGFCSVLYTDRSGSLEICRIYEIKFLVGKIGKIWKRI